MNEKINIKTNSIGEVDYEFEFSEGRLQTIRIQGPGDERRFYTIAPRMHELNLTYSVFKEVVYCICKMNPERIAELKENLRGDTEYFKILQRTIADILDQYKELLIM